MSALRMMFVLVLLGTMGAGCVYEGATVTENVTDSSEPSEPSGLDSSAPHVEKEVVISQEKTTDLPEAEAEWRERLTPLQFRVTRQHHTEPAFRNEYWDNKKAGVYLCVCCGDELFASDHKYVSRTGWPSFWQPINAENVDTSIDNTLFSTRTEVHCKRCQAHLGHVFEDGPPPTGLRYCMNSASLRFIVSAENSNDEK